MGVSVGRRLAIVWPVALLAAACGAPDLPAPPAPAARLPEAAPARALPPPSPLRYEPWLVEGAGALAAQREALGPERFDLVLKVNRIDLAHVRQGETILIPRNVVGPFDGSPFPFEVPELSTVPKLVAVSRQVQAFAAYEQGWLVRWGPTSTGRQATPTPAGLFFLNWKARETRSTDNEAWLLKWYFNFHNRRGVSFHEYELPGRPASHACVRLAAGDAEWLYGWGVQWILAPGGGRVLAEGTPVMVFDEYDWAAERAPWTRLAENPAAASVDAERFRSTIAAARSAIDEAGRRRTRLFLSSVPLQ